MAAFALRAEPTSVYIVFCVTRYAGCRKDDALTHRGGVTGIVSQLCVSTVQLEAGAGVVVEIPNLPIPAIVTVFALAAKCSTMDIVALMTRIAADGRLVLVERAFVATVALRYTMLAEQRIVGAPIVIKKQGFPVLFGTATFAGFAEPAFMRVVFLVTAVTGGRRLLKFRLWLVAGFGFHLLRVGMSAAQNEVGV